MPRKKTEQQVRDEQAFFMRISNPIMFRKQVLEASKTTLSILKQTYGIKQLRSTKHELISQIRKELKELKILIHKLTELIPAYKTSDLKKRFPEFYLTRQALAKEDEKKLIKEQGEPSSDIKEYKPESEFAQKPSELERVTRVLDEVQRRLQNL